MNTYRNNYNLIIEACKVEPDPLILEQYINKIVTWADVLRISYAHGVLPLIYKSLSKQPDFPKSLRQMFKEQNIQIAKINIHMTAELIRIAKLLDDHSIKYLALKGPTLSQLIHGNPIQRQYADLDILVEKEDVYKVGKLLYKYGYTSEQNLNFLNNKTLLRIGKDFVFINKKFNISIELHWKLFLDWQIKSSQIKLFSPNKIICNINNYNINTIELEHLLLYLCLHGSKHFWERIEWVVDIDRLIRSNKNIDWNKIIQIAQDMQVEVMFYVGLAVSQKMFNTPLTNIIQNKLLNVESIRNNIFELVFYRDSTQCGIELEDYKIQHLQTLLSDSISRNLRSYFLLLFQIKITDIYMINLPTYLYPLYYVIRFYNTILKIFKKLFIKN